MNKLFVLLLCLTAILSRKTYREDSNDLIDIITCILKYKSLIDDFDAVIDIINSKDYLKLLTLIPQIVSDGKKALELTIDVIPGILKLRVDSKFEENFDTIKDEFSVIAEYAPVTETDFSIKCKIIENNNTVFNLEAYAGSREQAKQIVNNWKKHAIHIYPEILHALVDEREEEI